MSRAAKGVVLLWMLVLFMVKAEAQEEFPAETDAEIEHDPVLEEIKTRAWLDYRLSPVDRRLALEDAAADNPFAISPHRTSYFLPVTYNSHLNREPWLDARGEELTGENLEKWEAKFQISLKAILLDRIFSPDVSLAIAYTQLSFWQFYNGAASRPFRETVHEPELFLNWLTDFNLLGMRQRIIRVGILHQSNGRSEPLSRSWNRIYGELVLERNRFVLDIRAWYRIKEEKSKDDNPDIHNYLGYGDIRLNYYLNQHEFSLTLRNNLDHDNRGAVQLEWSFPLYKKIRGYVQYFNGYGESLIDYNHSTNRLGVGFMLVNWM